MTTETPPHTATPPHTDTSRRTALGRRFGWLWAAFAVSTVGTWLAFDAFPLIAVLVLHAGPAAVSALAAVGVVAGAVLAVPLAPWVEFRRKRPVLIATDVVRFAALASVPVAYLLGGLGLAQLMVVAVIVAAGDIAFRSAAGATLKQLVPPDRLLVANGRFESTQWTATAIGPPLGGTLIGVLGPMATVVADAVSYLLSAAGLLAMGGGEPRPVRTDGPRLRPGDVLTGWRYVLGHPALRLLSCNTALVNGLIMAAAPLLAVLLLGDLGFAPWQYGLAFGVPCLGGLLGSRLAPRLVGRYGQHRVLLVSGVLRACFPVGLAFVPAGALGLLVVIAVEFGVITSCGVFNPVLATYRLERIPDDRVTRTLSAWSVTNNASIALLTALGGLLAAVAGTRVAILVAGLLLLATPLLLPRRAAPPAPPVEPAGA